MVGLEMDRRSGWVWLRWYADLVAKNMMAWRLSGEIASRGMKAVEDLGDGLTGGYGLKLRWLYG